MIVYETINRQNCKIASLLDEIDSCINLPDLSEFITIASGEESDFVPEKVIKIQKALSPNQTAWPLLITKSERGQIVDRMVEKCTAVFLCKEDRQYFSTWSEIRKFLNSLSTLTVDAPTWRQSITSSGMSEQAQRLPLCWLTSKDSQVAIDPVRYSTKSSSTGRLTVVEGPNFLTLPKACRKALRPAAKDSQIIEVDFTSLEPRVALQLFGNLSEEGDVYELLMKACGIKNRDTAKLATISTLYGASLARLAPSLGNKKSAQSVVESVRNFFGVAELEDKLEKQAREGLVRNIFGRPLRVATKQKRVRLNHVIQSTAADLANLLFSDLCKKCEYAKPLVVIHDALIVEIPNDKKQDFVKECNSLSYNGFRFPTKNEILHI